MKYFHVEYIKFGYEDSTRSSIGYPETIKVKIVKSKSMLFLIRKLKKKHWGKIQSIERGALKTTIWLKTPEEDIAHKTIEIIEGYYPNNDDLEDFVLKGGNN